MKNPLTLEEKVSLTRLIGHDIARHLEYIMLPDQNLEVVYARKSQVRYIMTAIYTMTQYDEPFFLNFSLDEFNIMQRLFAADDKKMAINFKTKEKDLSGDKNVLYAALYNLAKNGFNAMRGEGTVTITVSEHNGGMINNPVFVPQGAKQIGYFIKFDVHDTGKGFPQDKEIKEFLKLGVTTKPRGDGGFGLYFATLASKYLLAPIGITSKPGNTHVTLYHPINLGGK